MEQADRDTVDRKGAIDKNGTIDDSEYVNNSEKLIVLPLGKESKKITQVITNDTARQIIELLADQSMSVSDMAQKLDVPLTTIKYNIENLVDVGLAKIERIRYSEKGRQVKIYGPVRKLIVVVPEKTDSASITDILKKYLGVVLAAVFASGIVEILTGRSGKSLNVTDEYGISPDMVPEMATAPNVSERAMDSVVGVVNDTVLKSMSNETVPAATYIEQIIEQGTGLPAHFPTPLPSPLATYFQNAMPTSLPTSVPTPLIEQTVGVKSGLDAADLGLTSHLGVWFLLGCMFILILVIILDYRRQNR
ncbi:MAG: helix-turn-helix domain-containing protein [Methanosarcinales archaeon]|nr:helix-turn-helix domain-containing protein [ANME-2 cluster archaeon]MDF1531561.1 helix-turn-helix domain-containing protein [ANME-2 cluster archaeon]MDW7776327.1 helix-turn-helix domain-containing protein [Methanosarcinales archaeon]